MASLTLTTAVAFLIVCVSGVVPQGHRMPYFQRPNGYAHTNAGGRLHQGYPSFNAGGGLHQGYPRFNAGGGLHQGYPQLNASGGLNQGYPQQNASGGLNQGYPKLNAGGGHGGAVGRGGAGGQEGAVGHGGALGHGSARGHGGVTHKLPKPTVWLNPEDVVATCADRTTDQYFYKPGPVHFNKIVANINGGYNPEYGVFTAPVPGCYTITYNVATKYGSSKAAHVDLTSNGVVVNSAKAKGNDATASNAAVLILDQFDRISVQGREGTVIGCAGNGLCSFTVTMVKMGKFTDQKIPRRVPMDKW